MPKRKLAYYVRKTERLTGWLLVPVILLYLITGYATAGRLGVDRVLAPDAAYQVHQVLDRPLMILFLLHVLTAGYFSFRRWGWIGRRNNPTGGA